MKKLFALFLICFCLFPFCGINFASATEKTFVVNANSVNVFESPSFSSDIVCSLSYKTAVSLEMESSSPKVYQNEGFEFFKLIGNVEGYVLSDLISQEGETITSIPNYNAKLNSSCKVFELVDSDYVETEITLERNTQIFLYQGYDKKLDYTAIAFERENKVIYAYVQTKFISPNGINPLLITCVTLILAVLGIIFAWIFMKKSKIKKINGTKN